jgi:hypothetical protein
MWELDIAVEADGNVIAWKYRQEPFVVLADPRVRGRLRFCVYHEERLAAASRSCLAQCSTRCATATAMRENSVQLRLGERDRELR